MANKSRIRYGFVVLMLIFAGCSPHKMISENGIATNTLQQPTSPTISETTKQSIQTMTPTPSQTITPKSTDTATITLPPPTFTPLPTLSAEGAKVLILDLVQRHENCQLPCLWGITPGESNIDAVRAFVKRFQETMTSEIEITPEDYGDMGGLGLSYERDSTTIVVDFSYYRDDASDNVELASMVSFALRETGKALSGQTRSLAPIWGDPTFNQELQGYLLPGILSDYGPPSEVMLTVWPGDPERPDIKYTAFSLALYYPERGIFVEYVSPVEKSGKYYTGCPSKAHINLAVWDPESDITLKEIIKKAGSEIVYDYFKTLEEATELTMEEFFDKFSDPENTACLETPADMWSQP